jgi:hypothetical protein
MRLALLTALLGTLVLATGAVACGDSSSGGNGGTGGSGSGSVDCTRTDWDCAKVCANLATLCTDSACSGAQMGCTEPDCAASCEQTKAGLSELPDAQRKILIGEFNCLAANGSCLPAATCIATCSR